MMNPLARVHTSSEMQHSQAEHSVSPGDGGEICCKQTEHQTGSQSACPLSLQSGLARSNFL